MGNKVQRASYSANSAYVADKSELNAANEYTLKSEKPLMETLADHEAFVNCLAVSDDESVLVSGADDNKAMIWSITKNPNEIQSNFCRIESTKTKKNKKDKDGGTILALPGFVENLGVLTGHSGHVLAVGIDSKRRKVFTASADGSLRKWDMSSLACNFVYSGHQRAVHKLMLIPHGDFLVSSSSDGTARKWMMNPEAVVDEAEACLIKFRGHTRAVMPMIFIPGGDGDLLLTGSADATAKAWDFETGKCLRTFRGHKGAVGAMSVDYSGETLFTAGSEGTIR